MNTRRDIGHSVAVFTNYGNVAPATTDTFTTLGSSSAYNANQPSPRAFFLGVEVLISDSIEIVETSVQVTVCRGANGQYPIFSVAVPITKVGASTRCAGYKVLDQPRCFKNLRLTEDGSYDPADDDGENLYVWLHGTASPGTHDALVVVYWERMSE